MKETAGMVRYCMIGIACLLGCAASQPEDEPALDELASIDQDLLPARCTEHSQCASDVCNRSALLGLGACVSEARVVYVDRAQPDCDAADGSRANPVCQLRDAVGLAGGGKDTIRVYPGRYLNFGVNGGTLRVFGPGADDILIGEEDLGAGIRITGGAQVLLDGLSFGQAVRNGINCAASTVFAVRTQAAGDSSGIISTDCTLVLDRVRADGLTRSGLTVAGTGIYWITNSYFSGGDIQGVVFSGSSTGAFRFNTVVGSGEINPGGIDCGTVPRSIQDSIVVGNFSAAAGAQTVGACTHQRVVVGSGDTRPDPGLIRLDPDLDPEGRLLDTPASSACCIDRGPRLAIGASHDFFGTRRPQGPRTDLGAHELDR